MIPESGFIAINVMPCPIPAAAENKGIVGFVFVITFASKDEAPPMIRLMTSSDVSSD
jgi:hypothetical protein